MTARGEARRWVDALPGGSLFWSHDVPGPKTSSHPMLSRLASDPDRTGVERVHTGLYYKRSHPEVPLRLDWEAPHQELRLAFAIAGPGTGLTRYSALNFLGWAQQVPVAMFLAVAGTVPDTPNHAQFRWEPVGGVAHRLEMNGAECTVIEAVRWYVPFCELPWDWILDDVANRPSCQFWRSLAGIGAELRPDMLRRAARYETPNSLETSLAESPTCKDKPEHDHGERLSHIAGAVEYCLDVIGPAVDRPAGGQIAVEVRGYDTFDPATGNAAAGGPDDVACWMLDTDHDGESFYARRIHFPGAGSDRQIKKLLRELGKNADDVEKEALTAMRSAPFDPPERARIAVKTITTTGMEMTTVRHL